MNLGWRSSLYEDNLKLTEVYQWVWNIKGDFNWYAVLDAGDLGIEHNFDFRLQLSLDIRPEFYLNSNFYIEDHFGPDVALGVRYTF